jgi:hypothetical protein
MNKDIDPELDRRVKDAFYNGRKLRAIEKSIADLYIHKSSKKIYAFVAHGEVKIDGEWKPSVVYRSWDKIYTREKSDFDSKFEKV